MDYGKPGWSDAYYRQKFGLDPSDRVSIERVCQEYMLGLAWIMRYYCTGCASWDWFYPEHYAPLLRDLSAMNNVTVSFSLGQPISKLEAVIAVILFVFSDLDAHAVRLDPPFRARAARLHARHQALQVLSEAGGPRSDRVCNV